MFGVCKNTVKVLFMKSKVNSLCLLLSLNSTEYCGTTTGRGLALNLSVRRFLNLLSPRCVTLGRFFIVLNSSIALSRSFRSDFTALTFIYINFRAVNFSTVNVWILECHDLSIVCPWSEVRSLGWSLGCVLVVQLSVCKAVVHLYVLRRCSLRRVSSSTQSCWLVLLEIRLVWTK